MSIVAPPAPQVEGTQQVDATAIRKAFALWDRLETYEAVSDV